MHARQAQMSSCAHMTLNKAGRSVAWSVQPNPCKGTMQQVAVGEVSGCFAHWGGGAALRTNREVYSSHADHMGLMVAMWLTCLSCGHMIQARALCHRRGMCRKARDCTLRQQCLPLRDAFCGLGHVWGVQQYGRKWQSRASVYITHSPACEVCVWIELS